MGSLVHEGHACLYYVVTWCSSLEGHRTMTRDGPFQDPYNPPLVHSPRFPWGESESVVHWIHLITRRVPVGTLDVVSSLYPAPSHVVPGYCENPP